MAPKKLHYLTVQDILWINLQVTGKVNSFRYASLEEATYHQYGYGDSEDPLAQAARFLRGFLKQAPLSAGNEPTAFLAFATFLRLNGYHLNLPDDRAADWVSKGAFNDLTALVEPNEHHHHERMKDAVTAVRLWYPATIANLGGEPLEVVADGAIH